MLSPDEFKELRITGRIAFREGKPRSACPHEIGTSDRNAWLHGYDSLAHQAPGQFGQDAPRSPATVTSLGFARQAMRELNDIEKRIDGGSLLASDAPCIRTQMVYGATEEIKEHAERLLDRITARRPAADNTNPEPAA